MKDRGDKIQSEFEQKLRESELARKQQTSSVPAADTEATSPLRSGEAEAIHDNGSLRDDSFNEREALNASSTAGTNIPRDTNETQYIPVVEEQVRIDKKTIETGSVHVYKDVHEEQVSVDVPTVHEEVSVERVAINEYVDSAPPSVRYEGDIMIIPVLHEELVLVKRLKLVEELHVTKRRVETHESQQVTLRKEEVNVKRVDSNEANPGRV